LAVKQPTTMKNALRHDPLLVKLNDLALKLCKMRMGIVFPDETGWAQCMPGGPKGVPSFCQMIQSSPEGMKHCKMCHVLMTVAACSSGVTQQKCHIGISVLVNPINPPGHEQSLAVLSSCAFTSEEKVKPWKEANERGKKLKLDIPVLKKAFYELPVLSPEQAELAHELLALAAEAIRLLFAEQSLRDQLDKARTRVRAGGLVQDAVTKKLMVIGQSQDPKSKKTSDAKLPALISVIQDTVSKRPDYQYNVGEIAAAARMTPNHFSALFRRHTGRTFSSFLTARRLAEAKKLLGDFTLNISEIAEQVGFEDPGYFARRFRQKEGCSPREWRDKLQRDH
jgi:AraC-like DNA-binding protein/ligand-binding sensor protein